MKSTTSAKPGEFPKKWYVVDLDGMVLGRAATRIAMILRGKHKACYTPHVDTGDFVVVVNAAKVRLTGSKWKNKTYYRHTGYPGGIRSILAEKLRAKAPERLVQYAVWGMLPKNPLGRKMFKKLKVYPTAEHPHQAQKPEPLEI